MGRPIPVDNQPMDPNVPRGQSIVEYTMILSMVALLVVIYLAAMGEKTGTTYDNVANAMLVEDEPAGGTGCGQ